MGEILKRYWWIAVLGAVFFLLWRARRAKASGHPSGEAIQSAKLAGGGYTIAGVSGYEYERDPYATGKVGIIGKRNKIVTSAK